MSVWLITGGLWLGIALERGVSYPYSMPWWVCGLIGIANIAIWFVGCQTSR